MPPGGSWGDRPVPQHPSMAVSLGLVEVTRGWGSPQDGGDGGVSEAATAGRDREQGPPTLSWGHLPSVQEGTGHPGSRTPLREGGCEDVSELTKPASHRKDPRWAGLGEGRQCLWSQACPRRLLAAGGWEAPPVDAGAPV